MPADDWIALRERLPSFANGPGRGETAFWEALAGAVRDVAAAFAERHRVRNPDDLATEAAQEAMVHLLEDGGRRVRDPGIVDPRAWLRVVVTRFCLMRLRAARAGAGGAAGFLADRTAALLPDTARAPSPADEAARQEETERLLDALARLGKRDREMLVCRYLLDLPYERIAGRTGIPESQLGPRIERARERLARRLGAPLAAPRGIPLPRFAPLPSFPTVHP